VTHPLSKLVLLLLIWAFVHHLLAGLRHLAMDAQWGVSLHRARQSSLAVMLAAVWLTLLAAWRLFT
jgi:succinate dehydrogenase / fumarate reductase, cytochrome b subunit